MLEKFKAVQERARRAGRRAGAGEADRAWPAMVGADLRPGGDGAMELNLGSGGVGQGIGGGGGLGGRGVGHAATGSGSGRMLAGPPVPVKDVPSGSAAKEKPKTGLGRQLGRFGGGRSKKP